METAGLFQSGWKRENICFVGGDWAQWDVCSPAFIRDTSPTLHEVGCEFQHDAHAVFAGIPRKAERVAKNSTVLVPTRANNINASGLVKRDLIARRGFQGG